MIVQGHCEFKVQLVIFDECIGGFYGNFSDTGVSRDPIVLKTFKLQVHVVIMAEVVLTWNLFGYVQC